jgi:hypothetical protein
MTRVEWDHIVHYVNNLEQAIESFTNHGVHARMGGSHVEWGTHNALSYFGLTYIEFLAIENKELALTIHDQQIVSDANKHLPNHERLSRVALRTDQIDALVKHIRNSGIATGPILDGKRIDKNGRLIQWQMAILEGHYNGLDYPFLIQWNETDESRHARLSSSGMIMPHPAGQIQIKRAVFHVSDPLGVAARWSALFGLPMMSTNENEATLRIGEQYFDFIESKENHFKQVVLTTDSPNLQGKRFMIGEGEYAFVAME